TGSGGGTGSDPQPSATADPATVIPGNNTASVTQKAVQVTPYVSSNINAQNYENYHSPTVGSYLYENANGGLTRVEFIFDYNKDRRRIVVEDYDSSFNLLSSWTMRPELPEWGGFYAGKDYNFLVFGQDNDSEDPNMEVIRVVKYAKDWSQRLGHVSIYGANVKEPFRAASLRMTEYGGYLYLRTGRTMFKSGDGLNHQSNLTTVIRQSDMAVTERDNGYGYASHSFNQFILVDQDKHIVALDHGDSSPRSIRLTYYTAEAGQDILAGGREQAKQVDLLTFPGKKGDNTTGCTIGGFAETSNGYVTAYSYDGRGTEKGSRDVYLDFTDKSLSNSAVKLSSGYDVSTPVLASNGLNGGYVMWNQRHIDQGYWKMDTIYDSTVYYTAYDANGRTGAVKTAAAALSDCAPIQYRGGLVWYVTDNSVPTFYTLDASGITAHPVAPIVNDSVAYPNTQTVLLDGKSVTFQTYALHDNYGGETNYIRIRDMAHYLNGTKAQFEVEWRDEWGTGDGTILLSSGYPYTPNGSELSTPFSGPRAYQVGTGGKGIFIGARQYSDEEMGSIILTADDGGGYTYFKLRDLGKYLGFNVSYIDGQVVVNTGEPYSDAQ
ncbi:MAG: hypothetical protein NC131_15250, partial [Roseburia sp.]|nr:hypothetical protein [Roseburia sp.]